MSIYDAKLLLPEPEDNLYLAFVLIFFFSSPSQVLLNAVSEAHTQGYLPEISITFTACKTKCQYSKETNFQLPSPLLCVCILLPCHFWRKKYIKCAYNHSHNYRNTEWFVLHLWKFLLAHPGDGLNSCLLLSISLFSASMTFPKQQTVSPIGCIPSSLTELCRSAMPGSFLPSSSSRGNTFLPQSLLWDTGTWEVWVQSLQVKTINIYSLHRISGSLEYFLYWSYGLLSKYLCIVMRTSVIKQEMKE